MATKLMSSHPSLVGLVNSSCFVNGSCVPFQPTINSPACIRRCIPTASLECGCDRCAIFGENRPQPLIRTRSRPDRIFNTFVFHSQPTPYQRFARSHFNNHVRQNEPHLAWRI
jgi:hypothetical protein